MPSFWERYGALIFWVPMGIASMLSFRWVHTSDPQGNESQANSKQVANGATSPILLDYELVENATVANAHGQTGRVLRYSAVQHLTADASAFVSTRKWAQLLSDGPSGDEYIEQFMDLLADAPFGAYFFETRGVSLSNANVVPFEFVLVESAYLYRFADAQQDADTFGDQFEQCDATKAGCAFPNPSGTSVLIAPMQQGGTDANTYGHLASFARRAPREQRVQFWKIVLEAYLERLTAEDPNKVWLSTDGTGVAWLHVRLDPQPKYYDYVPYKEGGRL